MSEEVVFQEMIAAGSEQVTEARKMNLTDEQMALQVYLAMRGVYVMACARGKSERVH